MQASQRKRDEAAKPAPAARGVFRMTFLRRVPRRVIQLICFVGAVVLVWPVLPWAIAPRIFVQASPFVALSSSIATRSISLGIVFALVVAVASSFKKRWFCLYLCPTGLLLENVSHAGLRKTSWWSKCPPIGRYRSEERRVGKECR